VYRIQRTEKEVKILDNRGGVVYEASLDAYVIYDQGKSVAKVKDLEDGELLKALVAAVEIKRDLGSSGPR